MQERVGPAASGGSVNAFEELERTGEIGPECYRVFIGKARQVVRTHNFPPPCGHARWLDEDVEELVQAVFEAKKGRAITLKLLECTSQDSVEAMATTIVHNYLKDQAKSTEVGKLRRRLEPILRADERFTEVPRGWWSLTGGPTEPSWLDQDALARAAHNARDVTLDLPLNTAGKTSAHNVAGLSAISLEVLTAALGAVETQPLARAVASRCGLLLRPAAPLIDANGHEVSLPAADARSNGTEERALAAEIVARLDLREREAVWVMSSGETALAGRLGVGRRQAAAIKDRVRGLIAQVTEPGEERRAVLAEVVTLVAPRPGHAELVTSSDLVEMAPVARASREDLR